MGNLRPVKLRAALAPVRKLPQAYSCTLREASLARNVKLPEYALGIVALG